MMDHTYESEIGFLDLMDGLEFEMLSGLNATVTIGSDGFYINDAKITVFELKADNGIVYVIDAIIAEPVIRKTIYDWLSNSPDHLILKQVVDLSGLDDDLTNDSDLSLFAPNDDAFNALPPGQLTALLADPQGALRDLLRDHIHEGVLSSSDLSNNFGFILSNGLDALVTVNPAGKFVNESKILEEDITADNGIVHTVESVLMPRPSSVNDLYQDLSIYPNPSNAFINIDLRNLDTTGSFTTIRLINSIGEEVIYERVNSSNTTLDLKNLDDGLYLLLINDNLNYAYKILKQ